MMYKNKGELYQINWYKFGFLEIDNLNVSYNIELLPIRDIWNYISSVDTIYPVPMRDNKILLLSGRNYCIYQTKMFYAE
jgi:hypothetical protein